ncbi:MAG TPA: hypothetical protein VD978_19100 [Azospirillum sp.]|nr:hypothetical protein [Azospirillum sp.]
MKTARRTIESITLTAVWVALAAPSATAQETGQTCRDQLDRFAETQNLSTEPPPTAVPPGTAGSTSGSQDRVTSEDLGRSGGVVTPPAMGDRSVIEPAHPLPDRMPTAPPIRPETGAALAPNGGAMAEAARRTQMEALITAGRAAAQRGNEAQCMDSLAKARWLSESGAPPAGGGRPGHGG